MCYLFIEDGSFSQAENAVSSILLQGDDMFAIVPTVLNCPGWLCAEPGVYSWEYATGYGEPPSVALSGVTVTGISISSSQMYLPNHCQLCQVAASRSLGFVMP